MKYFLLVLCLFSRFSGAQAQIISFKDTIAEYNLQRIRTNLTGEQIIGAWGLANIAAGGIGYTSAKKDEWKSFHEMNAGFGALNTLLAGAGLLHSYGELHKHPGFDQSYKLYKNNKRTYIISSGLDVVFIICGTTMVTRHTNPNTPNAAILTGFGKSISLQGIALLIFDNLMYASHLRNNSNWRQIMSEIQLSGNGIGFNYTF